MTSDLHVFFVGFLRATAVLSLPADLQLEWLDALGVGRPLVADELALEFSDGCFLLDQFSKVGWLRPRSVELFRQLDALLESISGPSEIWSREALQDSSSWSEIRHLAGRCIVSLR